MKIFVCVKPVFGTDVTLKIHGNSDIVAAKETAVINPFDEYAIEEALLLREMREGSTVTVVSYGKENQQEVSYSALALGADSAVFINGSGNTLQLDSYKTAMQLYNYISKENPDIIIMGKEAVDTRNGAVGPVLASLMEIPVATDIQKCSYFQDFVAVERAVAGGIRQKIKMNFPCVITVTKGINKPRYPSIKGILGAKKKPLLILEEQEPSTKYENIEGLLSYPPERSNCTILKDGDKDIAEQILKILKLS